MPTDGYKLAQNYETAGSTFNQERFSTVQLLKDLHTAQVVQVLEVFPSLPGDAKANIYGNYGFVHAELVVEQVDNKGCRVEMKPLFNLPYIRLQGGKASFVIDPKPKDFGLAIFCERDISLFKRTIAKCLPDTARMFSQSDGIYIGGILNEIPEVYVMLDDKKGVTISCNAPNVIVTTTGNCSISASGSINIDGGSGVYINGG